MHDALVVGRLERPADLDRHGNRLPPAEPAAAAQELFKALAANEFHREEGLFVLFAKREQADDPRMPQVLECVNLCFKP